MAVHPRRPKGPPLNALRAFEAAARLGGFVAAAEELHVTPGAISQHIKTLEAWAGAPLFRRNAQGVTLTNPGQSLASDFTAAFDHLAAATQRLRNLGSNPDIHIAALPSVAQIWLPPRLGRLRRNKPHLNISVTALETPPRLSREFFDLSIFFAPGTDDPDQITLARDVIFPVCAPGIAARTTLDTIRLLHDQTWADDWTHWSRETGIPVGDPTRGARYSLYSLALEEAKSGAGALMGHGCLVEQALADGQLVAMSDHTCPTGRALIATLPHPSRRRPDMADIVAFLKDPLRP